jgi:hypothetical protein
VVWQWSDGQVFDQTGHEREIWTDWSAQVEVPVQASAAGGGYVLRAWMTTSGGPRLAAVVPLVVGQVEPAEGK